MSARTRPAIIKTVKDVITGLAQNKREASILADASITKSNALQTTHASISMVDIGVSKFYEYKIDV